MCPSPTSHRSVLHNDTSTCLKPGNERDRIPVTNLQTLFRYKQGLCLVPNPVQAPMPHIVITFPYVPGVCFSVSFFVFHSLDVLKGTGQLFCRKFLSLSLSDVYL